VPQNVFRPVNNLGFLLAKAGQGWNELLYSKFCEAGYSDVRPAYGSILMPLFEEDGLQIGELGRRAQLSKQTMTTMIDVMERRKLISRKRDPRDARAFRIYLTKRSRRFKIVAAKVLREMDRATESNLNRRQISALKTSLSVLINLGPVNRVVPDYKVTAGARRAKADRST
jgi:DNA-binding MarR family transcriptional regulator